MINMNQRKAVCKFLRRLSSSSVICLCCRKVNTNLGDGNYEEKSIMYGNGSNHTADTNGIGSTLADEAESTYI